MVAASYGLSQQHKQKLANSKNAIDLPDRAVIDYARFTAATAL